MSSDSISSKQTVSKKRDIKDQNKNKHGPKSGMVVNSELLPA
jgi:hypothetical protein